VDGIQLVKIRVKWQVLMNTARHNSIETVVSFFIYEFKNVEGNRAACMDINDRHLFEETIPLLVRRAEDADRTAGRGRKYCRVFSSSVILQRCVR
jgi:hypothetical protein